MGIALCFSAQGVAANISAVWANEGGDKVAQDELRATLNRENLTGTVHNRAWNGNTITLSAAHNEVVSFNLVLEAAFQGARNVNVSFDTLTGPNGATIHSAPASGNGVFTWTDRPIELFYERYLQIKGLSFFGYWKGNEHIFPRRFQLPSTGNGSGIGFWTDRPDHDKYYPDVMVPLELVPNFSIASGQNQSVWGDIYVPKTVPAGTYTGNITVGESGQTSYTVPVQLTVYGFELPDTSKTKVMMPVSTSDIMWRYVTGYGGYANPGNPDGQRVFTISDRYFQLFHRHKIALLGENDCVQTDAPCPASVPRYTGSLFTASHGYDGPGVNTPNGVYGVGMYETWNWRSSDESAMWQHTNNWMNWFNQNAPGTTAFLYLADEPSPANVSKVNMWSQWMKENPGPGKDMVSMSTYDAVLARTAAPDLSAPVTHAGIGSCPFISICNATAETQSAADFYTQTSGKHFWMYNDGRPGVGTLNTEDDGVAPRQIAWAQYKKNIERWYYWNSNLSGTNNLFQNAITWGSAQFYDLSLGWTGNNGTTNGNGTLSYPGTDVANPGDSYGVDGPFASLRLKEWRRGIQDADYLTLAARINPTAVQQIMNNVAPRVLWEYPAPGGDPSYYLGDLGWSVNPDDWENARAQLAAIITGSGAQPQATPAAPAVVADPTPAPTPTTATTPAATDTASDTSIKTDTSVPALVPVAAPDPAIAPATSDPAVAPAVAPDPAPTKTRRYRRKSIIQAD